MLSMTSLLKDWSSGRCRPILVRYCRLDKNMRRLRWCGPCSAYEDLGCAKLRFKKRSIPVSWRPNSSQGPYIGIPSIATPKEGCEKWDFTNYFRCCLWNGIRESSTSVCSKEAFIDLSYTLHFLLYNIPHKKSLLNHSRIRKYICTPHNYLIILPTIGEGSPQVGWSIQWE